MAGSPGPEALRQNSSASDPMDGDFNYDETANARDIGVGATFFPLATSAPLSSPPPDRAWGGDSQEVVGRFRGRRGELAGVDPPAVQLHAFDAVAVSGYCFRNYVEYV